MNKTHDIDTFQAIAREVNALRIPNVVSDLLSGKETLCGDLTYTIHTYISDLEPNRALQCIAISALKITRIYSLASPGMRILEEECMKILNDIHTKTRHEDAPLVLILECLEIIAELLDLNKGFLKDKDTQAAELFKIFVTQARAQALICRHLVDILDHPPKRATLAWVPRVHRPKYAHDNAALPARHARPYLRLRETRSRLSSAET